jgi:hypothetical protein
VRRSAACAGFIIASASSRMTSLRGGMAAARHVGKLSELFDFAANDLKYK